MNDTFGEERDRLDDQEWRNAQDNEPQEEFDEDDIESILEDRMWEPNI